VRIGIVSLWWLPHFGGGEAYTCRLAEALQRRGIAVEVITTSPARPDRDNGGIAALRCGAAHDPQSMPAFRRYLQGGGHAAWCERVVRWAAEHRFTHVLCNAPLARPGFSPAAAALFEGLRATGAIVGAIHHDLGPRTLGSLVARHAECGDWDEAAAKVGAEQRAKAIARGARAFHDAAASPLYYDPAFVIGCSHWSTRFIDPLDAVPKFVLHPLQAATPAAAPAPGADLDMVTVAMINPLPQKGALNMVGVILSNGRGWTFRVLQGGWGDAFQGFAPMIAGALHAGDGRVAMLPYVRDMPAFYRAARVFMFPSRQEGYGMAPVEAMQAGTPVVATDYPAIREAVGDGARIVPYHADGRDWVDAIAEVLDARDLWRERTAARVRELEAREAAEVPALVAFLRALPAASAARPQPGG
jgi:glycosyltransferase involved in cell wall biosynthesis